MTTNRPVGLLCGAVWLLIVSGPAAGCGPEGEPAGRPGGAEAVARIERECLRAYPAELLSRMTTGAEESVPPSVDADPTAQPKFLDRDLAVSKGIFYPSYLLELLPALESYVKPGTSFLDLGSGDGRVVFLANILGADALGVEWEPELVAVSRRAMEALSDLVEPARLKFLQGDFFEIDWSDFDVIFYFGNGSSDPAGIQDKLRKEMAPHARLILAHESRPFPGFEMEAHFPSVKVMRRRF